MSPPLNTKSGAPTSVKDAANPISEFIAFSLVFTVKAFLAGAFFNAIPGIIVQLTIIPAIMIALNREKLIPFTNRTVDEDNAYVK